MKSRTNIEHSELVKEGLRKAKARGVKLGNPNPEGIARGRKTQANKAQQFAENLAPILREIQADGHHSLVQIANELNARNITTARGGKWHPSTVENILKRL